MAQLDDTQDMRGTATTSTPTREAQYEEVLIADLFASNLSDRDQSYDPDADAFERLATIKPGVYGVKMAVAKDGLKLLQPKGANDVNYKVETELHIVDTKYGPEGADAFEGLMITNSFTTIVSKGKKTSTMATVMAKMGANVAKVTKVLQLAQAFVNFLKKEPVIYVEIDWRASYPESDEPGAKWVNLFWSATEFPKDPMTGEPMERFEYPTKNGPRMVYAKPNLKGVYGKEGNIPNEAKYRKWAKPGVSTGTGANATTAPVTTGATASRTTQPPVNQGATGGQATTANAGATVSAGNVDDLFNTL